MDWLGDLGKQTGGALQGLGDTIGDGFKWTENAAKSALPSEVHSGAHTHTAGTPPELAHTPCGFMFHLSLFVCPSNRGGIGREIGPTSCSGQGRVHQDSDCEGGQRHGCGSSTTHTPRDRRRELFCMCT